MENNKMKHIKLFEAFQNNSYDIDAMEIALHMLSLKVIYANIYRESPKLWYSLYLNTEYWNLLSSKGESKFDRKYLIKAKNDISSQEGNSSTYTKYFAQSYKVVNAIKNAIYPEQAFTQKYEEINISNYIKSTDCNAKEAAMFKWILSGKVPKEFNIKWLNIY